ncbi:MAG: hypothetical protein M0Q38_01395 [Bacteroidales bacterium]|jgi:hypothetical protein|nr:hypothetical protein [Bacteroidales bacterium]
MKKSLLRVAQTLSILAIFVLGGCTTTKIFQTSYQKVPYLSLAKDVPASQTKGGIIVELRTTKDNDYQEFGLKRNFTVKYKPIISLGTVLDENGLATDVVSLNFNLTEEMAVFMVTINNNTDHILRMNDSRIIFVTPTSDDPKLGLNKESLKSLITELPIYNKTVSYLMSKYPETSPESIKNQVAAALFDIFGKMKIINNLGKEIIPSMKSTGFLLFDISPKKVSEGKISFVDVVSKTDQAGNPTEKVRFDYQTALNYEYYKLGPEGKWTVISENEYTTGLSNPPKYYYDKAAKRWVEGTPHKK